MTYYFDWCCGAGGWCAAKYDDEMVCPCVPHDGRECIANCCYALLVIGLILGIIVCIPLVLVSGVVIVRRVRHRRGRLSGHVRSRDTAADELYSDSDGRVAVTYNLSMTVRVHNPNWFLGVDFTAPLKARYSFDGALFGQLVWLAREGEKLPADNTRVYCLTTGAVDESVPDLGVDGFADFARQSSAGVFEVDVVVAGHYTVRGAKRSLAATCPLKLPLGAPPGASQKVGV